MESENIQGSRLRDAIGEHTALGELAALLSRVSPFSRLLRKEIFFIVRHVWTQSI